MYKVWMKRRGEQPRFRSSFDLIGTFGDRVLADQALKEASKQDQYAYGSVIEDDDWPYPHEMYSKG